MSGNSINFSELSVGQLEMLFETAMALEKENLQKSLEVYRKLASAGYQPARDRLLDLVSFR